MIKKMWFQKISYFLLKIPLLAIDNVISVKIKMCIAKLLLLSSSVAREDITQNIVISIYCDEYLKFLTE